MKNRNASGTGQDGGGDDRDLVARIRECVRRLERSTGETPDLNTIAGELGVSLSLLRQIVSQLCDGKSEGSSAFEDGLWHILLRPSGVRNADIGCREDKDDVKEIRMRYKIEDQDYQLKLRRAQKFLGNGNRVKVLIQLRGREQAHLAAAIELMKRFVDDLHQLAACELGPELSGKTVTMLLAPANQGTSNVLAFKSSDE